MGGMECGGVVGLRRKPLPRDKLKLPRRTRRARHLSAFVLFSAVRGGQTQDTVLTGVPQPGVTGGAPSAAPTPRPTESLIAAPSPLPTQPHVAPDLQQAKSPSPEPTFGPTPSNSMQQIPTPVPTAVPTPADTAGSTLLDTPSPSSTTDVTWPQVPTPAPTPVLTADPTATPTPLPPPLPTALPTASPTSLPSADITGMPSPNPTPMPTPQPLVYVGMNLTFVITNVDSDAVTFNSDYLMQGVIKDAVTNVVILIKRTDIESVVARNGWSATVLALFLQLTMVLNGSGYKSAETLFTAVTTDFNKAVQDGSLARQLQKLAKANGVSALSTVTVVRDSYTSPNKFSVNGMIQVSAPETQHQKQQDSMPMSVVISAVIGGLVIFGAMFHYSRARAERYMMPEDAVVIPAGDGHDPADDAPDPAEPPANATTGPRSPSATAARPAAPASADLG